MGARRRGARLGWLTLLAFSLGCGESSPDGDDTTSGTGGSPGARGGAGGSAGQAPNVGGRAGSTTAGSAGSGAGGSAGAHAGSGGSPSGAGGMSPSGGAPDQATAEYRACADYVKARCKRIDECGGIYSEGYCLESELPLCPDSVFGPGSNNKPELIAQCAVDWLTSPCTIFQTFTPVCIYAPGDFENGESCTSAVQCKSGMCKGSDTFCGTCERVYEPGESCADGASVCPYGHECDGAMCVLRTATALPAGSVCDESYDSCHADYVCRDDGRGQTKCQEPLAPGATCEAYQCALHYYCDLDTHVCVANPSAGMPCGGEGIGACDEHSYCDRSQEPRLCVARAALGGTCFDDPDVTDVHGNCETGLFCVCEAGEDCTDGVCMAQALEGGDCGDPTTFCVAGTQCRAGKCAVSGLQGTYAETCMK